MPAHNTKNEELEKILGTPFSGDLPENAIKIRRNLMAVSFVSILMWWSSATLDPESSILGLRFIGMPSAIVSIALLVLNIYFLIHFLSYAFEAFLEWRIRLTGRRVIAYTGGDLHITGSSDATAEPRQATLYSWLPSKIPSIRKYSDLIDEAKTITHELSTAPQSDHSPGQAPDVTHIITQLEKIEEKLTDALNGFTALGFDRLTVSLSRFDDWFNLSLRIQSARWLILDLCLPILLGIVSASILVCNVSTRTS